MFHLIPKSFSPILPMLAFGCIWSLAICNRDTFATVFPDPLDPSQETSTSSIGSGSVTQFLNGSNIASRSPPIRSDPVAGIEEAIWGSVLPVQPLPLFTLPKTGANLYVRAELELLPNDVKVDLTQPLSGETFADSDEITIQAKADGDPQLTLLAGVDLTLRDGSVEESSCPIDLVSANLSHSPQVSFASQTYCYLKPADRHYFNKIRGSDPPKKENTIILPNVNVANDVASINSGSATLAAGIFTINGRRYGYHGTNQPGVRRLYPVDGTDLRPMSKNEYKVFTIFKKYGGINQDSLHEINSNPAFSQSDINRAQSVYQEGISLGGRP